ncbi:MAG: phosphate ABC transporter ATP-binding protein [Planctomycetota bacterium]|nr:phosphate ABC transporter ATP-binding protein [Planctomycetota bacterium]
MTENEQNKIRVSNLSVSFDGSESISGLTINLPANQITAVIGPAKSGKTTFLNCLNRMIDLFPGVKVTGQIFIDGADIYGEDVDVTKLRRRVGIVFAVPIPLPGSIYENMTLGLRLKGMRQRTALLERAEAALKEAYLWEEVQDRLNQPAMNLSGGQQQRLCLARTLALRPEIILMDEPCSGLDPISTAKIEEALQDLKTRHTVVLVTNNVKQAARASDRTAFFLSGKLVEFGPTDSIFTNPREKKTEEYIRGKFG